MSDAHLARAVDAFRATPGILGTPVGEGLDEAMRVGADDPAHVSGRWEALRRWLAGERHEVVGSEQHSVELAAYWLTVPSGTGATVTLTSSLTSSSETAASFTIAGIGGGPTFSLDVKEDVSFEATKDQRVATSLPGAWEGAAQLSLARLGLTTKIATSVKYERELSFAYQLEGGHDYLAARYDAFPAYLWTVRPA